MKERGEATLFGILALVVLSGVLLLCSLELAKSFQLLQKRTHLFLCVKETKGELNNYLRLMGRTNWAIKNINLAKWVMIFIPGMQGVAMNADKMKEVLIQYQNISLPLYLHKLHQIKKNKCTLDPRMYMTPYELGGMGYKRGISGSAKLRKMKWTYYYLNLPYALSMEIDALNQEQLAPKIKYKTTESGVKSFSLSSFAY